MKEQPDGRTVRCKDCQMEGPSDGRVITPKDYQMEKATG